MKRRTIHGQRQYGAADSGQSPSPVSLPLVEWLRLFGFDSSEAKAMTLEEVVLALDEGMAVPTHAAAGEGSAPAPSARYSVTSDVTPPRYNQPSPEPRSDRLFTAREAATSIGCSEDTIRRAYTCGELKIIRFGAGRVRIASADLASWLARGGRTKAPGPKRRKDGCP